jgi:hypothetical protein
MYVEMYLNKYFLSISLLHSCHKLLNEIIIFLWAQYSSHMSWILGTRNFASSIFCSGKCKAIAKLSKNCRSKNDECMCACVWVLEIAEESG